MGVTLMKDSKAWQVARQAWGSRRGIAARKCEGCFRAWRKSGSKQEETPPLFPPDYKGCCPTCGGRLSQPGIGL